MRARPRPPDVAADDAPGSLAALQRMAGGFAARRAVPHGASMSRGAAPMRALPWTRIDTAVLAALTLLVAWWFWPHLSGSTTFIGDSDRMNHFLTWLRNFASGLRRGYIPTWNESLFGGYSVVALPYTYPNLFAALAALWPARLLIVAAGWISALLMVLAGWAAYVFARDVTRERLTALTAAVLYQSCALTTLKVSQNDMSFAVLIIIPLATLILRRVRSGNMALCFLGLALLLTHLLTVNFLQKAAYACIFFALYALYRLAISGNWRAPFVLGSAAAVAIVASFPRLMTDGIELTHSVRRYIGGQSDKLNDVYTSIGRFFNFEILRAFDERIFGRNVVEASLFGNIFNLSEGLLVYSSTFATLLILYGTIRYLPGLSGRRRRWGEDAPFHTAFIAFCVFVVLSKLGFAIMYVLMGRVDFIHARILVAAVLPLATLAALYLCRLGGGDDREPPVRARWSRLAAAALAAGLLVAASEYVADATAGQPVPLGIREGFTANLTVAAGSLLRIGFSLVLFLAVLASTACLARRSPWRGVLMAFLAFLMIFQAAAFGAFQLRGDQLKSDWQPDGSLPKAAQLPAEAPKLIEAGGEPMPFRQAGRLLARADEFRGPSAEALTALDRRLERDDYRSAIVCDVHKIQIFCSPHIANFWRLRLIEGYISSIPERIETLPWPRQALSQRSISFTSFQELPWPLLSLFNVKYAVEVQPALFTDAVRLPDGTSRELRPEDLEIRESPLAVTPRVFFAATVQSVAGPEAALEALFPKGKMDPEGYDVARLSYAEGSVGGRYATAGAPELKAVFRDQYATITFPPAAGSRFLVVDERYDPYWRAYVDGKRAAIYPTNVAMRGVVVPAGAREVTMVYRPYDTSGRAWGFYLGGLALFVAGLWGIGRLDRHFPRLTAAEIARPLVRGTHHLRAWLAAWLPGNGSALLVSLSTLAAFWIAAALLVFVREPRVALTAALAPLAGILLVRADQYLAPRKAALGDQLSVIAAFLFMLAIWSVSLVLWRRAGGFFGIHDTGESVAIFLSSYHVRDLASFFLQDHAASSDPAALGYYYIHHPNFVSRFFAMIGIGIGMSQEALILACLMLSALSLLLGFLALRRLFGPVAALGTVAFFGTSYGVYFAQAGDLLRGLHAVMWWALVYVMALEWDGPPHRARRPQPGPRRPLRSHRLLGLGLLPLRFGGLRHVARLCPPPPRRAPSFSLGPAALRVDFPRLFWRDHRAHGHQVLRDRSPGDLLRAHGERACRAAPRRGLGPAKISRSLSREAHRHVGRKPNPGPSARRRHRLLAGHARGQWLGCAPFGRRVPRLCRRDSPRRLTPPCGARRRPGPARSLGGRLRVGRIDLGLDRLSPHRTAAAAESGGDRTGLGRRRAADPAPPRSRGLDNDRACRPRPSLRWRCRITSRGFGAGGCPRWVSRTRRRSASSAISSSTRRAMCESTLDAAARGRGEGGSRAAP